MIGLTRGTTSAHIARAALESITFQCNDVLRAMMNDAGARLTELRVDGGASENDLMMQFQADMLGIPVEVPEEKETCAFGAACLAGYTMGELESLESLREKVKIRSIYEPRISQDEREERLNRWREAAERSMNWARR